MKNSLLLTLVLGLTLTGGAGAASNNSPSLHDAIKAGKPSAVKEALTRARINEYNAAGMTPLMVAAMYDRSTSARILLAAGADANIRTAQYGTTALMMAAMNGYHEVVAELIQGGAALNMGNKSGFTALMLAAQKGHATVVQQLLQAGADPQVQDASHRTALQHAATDDIRTLLNTPLGTQAGAPLPGMVEAIEQLRKLQGSPVQFAALRFSMSAGDGEQGYLYHFLGQDSFCKLVFAGNEYLVTTQRVFGSFSDNLVALHFWDSRTFSYISSVLHNGPMNGLILFSEDEATGRFAMAFSHQYSRTDGVLAYDIKSDTLEYSVGFDINAHLFNNKGCTPLSFKSSKFGGMPPFKESAGDISLNNTLNLRKIPQLAGLAHNFSATDEETLRSIEFSTLRTIPYTHEEWPRNTDGTDIPGLPDGMKAIAVHEEYGRALLRSPYVICIPDTHKDLRTFAWDWEEKGRPETSKSLYIYDLGRKKLYPMPQFILECPTYTCSAWPEFGDSDCEKIVHNTVGVHRSGASWSGAEIFNPQSGKYEKIHFNDSPHESRPFDTTNQAIAYRLDGKVPDADTLGSSLSVLNRVPGQDGYLYWLAAGPGNCALFLIDESTKTGKLVQSWQGAWGRSLWAPNRPNPVWLQEQKWLCLPMKDHCWEIYDLADPTQSTEKKFNVYTGAGRSWAIMLPNGHYAGTPGCESLFYEKKENEQRGIQALAPWRNRPAEVLEAIGGNADDIAALKETTKRWLARQALDVANLPDEPPHAAFPSAEAEKTPLMQEAEQLEMDVKLTAAGKKALTALEVRVDGAYIPQEWENALLIPRGQSQTVRVKIPLRIGQNNIELTPIDSTALEGERVSFRAVRPGQPESRLFVVTLGVSDYDDDSLDLQFAAKDAKDLAAAFAEHGLGEVKSLTLTDKDVSDAGVLEKVQTFLSESKAEDRVVLYLAGHGMLDDKLDYHYAPASFDVENVSKTGISMSRLTGMLQSIPARERLLLLDTCHSGQLGEAGEEKLAANGVQLPHGVRAIQHRGMKVKKATGAFTNASQQKRYIEEMFNLSQEFRGINIVAGAAGAEYALESGEWSNGVFTAAIIRTLKNVINADQNADGLLSVDEMLSTLQKQVSEMTGGAQKPNIVAAENSGMALAADTCYEVMQSDWKSICTRIQKAGSAQEALFMLDLIDFYQTGCLYADTLWEDSDYGKDTYLSQRGRNYDDTQCEHLKKAFLLGQKSSTNKREVVPADVWKAAILRGVSPDIIRKDFSWNDSDDSYKLLDFMIEKGSNPNRQNEDGNTMLHFIARYGDRDTILPKKHLDTLYVLLRHGADSSICNHKGESAVNEQCDHYMLVQAVEKLVRYTREHTQSPLADGFAPATLSEKIAVLDYTRAEASLYDIENDTRAPFKKIDARHFGSLKKAIQPGFIKEDSIAYVRAYTKTGSNTAKLSKLYVFEPGFHLAQLVADHADALSAEQIADILSVYLQDAGAVEIELSFTSPTTATGTEVSLLDSYTEQTIRQIDVSLSDTLPPMETEPDTTDTEQRETQEEATEDRSSLDPLIARMAALKCKQASSALYQKRLLTLLPMIRNGADINLTLPETKGNTALHYSCAIGSLSITRWLLEHGANANAVTDAGKTPLQCVGSDNRAAIIQALKAHGAQ